MTPERLAQIRGRLADLPCREWAICTETSVDPPRSGIRLLRVAVPCQGDAAITTPEGGPVRRAVAELFANSGRDIADLLAALEAAEARVAASEAEAGQLRAVFSQDFLADNDAARLAYERGVQDGREQVAEENAQAALADFDDDDGPDDSEPDDAPGAGPPVTSSLADGWIRHEVSAEALLHDGVPEMMAAIQALAAGEVSSWLSRPAPPPPEVPGDE